MVVVRASAPRLVEGCWQFGQIFDLSSTYSTFFKMLLCFHLMLSLLIWTHTENQMQDDEFQDADADAFKMNFKMQVL